jgi:methylmalonyl-CoA mutase cobalamin-binding domain/chain
VNRPHTPVDASSEGARAPARAHDPPVRVLLAKVGLDGHDRGLRVVARVLRDHGFEVIFAGLRQTPEAIAAAVVQEDVDVVGVSMHNGAHLTLAPAVISALHEVGLDTPVIVGGIVPDVDVPRLREMGVAAVLGPGASNDEVVDAVSAAASRGADVDAQRGTSVTVKGPAMPPGSTTGAPASNSLATPGAPITIVE